MNKRGFARICALGLIIASTGVGHADDSISLESNSDIKIIKSTEDNTVVEFNEVTLDLPYNSDDINISCDKYENKTEFTVTDKNTNEVLSRFGEEILKIEENVYFSETKSIGQRASKNLYREFNFGPCRTRLNQPINYNTSGSFKWIDGAGKASLSQISGGNWSLSGTTLKNNWKGQQLNVITVDAMTTVTVKTDSTITGDFSKKNLEKNGFNMQLTSSDGFKNYYTGRWTPSKRFGFSWNISTNTYKFI